MNIWVPKGKIIEPKCAIEGVVGLEGKYRIQVYRPDGRMRLDTGWFPNIIVDTGLDRIGSNQDYLGQCRVGTGNATPAATDTALQTQIATTTSTTSNVGAAQASAPYYGSRTIVYRFAAGVAAGNLTEVGIGVSGGVLFSRALILDGGGVPTSITVLADEFLDVTYQLRIKPPLSDVGSSVNISGTNYTTVTRAGAVTNASHWGNPGLGGLGSSSDVTPYTGALAAITTLPTGALTFTFPVAASYSSGTNFREGTATWGLDVSNGTIQCVSFGLGQAANGGWGRMQMSFSPSIVKDNTKILSMTFRHTWARGTP